MRSASIGFATRFLFIRDHPRLATIGALVNLSAWARGIDHLSITRIDRDAADAQLSFPRDAQFLLSGVRQRAPMFTARPHSSTSPLRVAAIDHLRARSALTAIEYTAYDAIPLLMMRQCFPLSSVL